MRIGELAERTGVSVRSLRYYESQGLIDSERTAGGQRVYEQDAVDRVNYLQRLYRAGLSSQAIRAVLPCLDTPSLITSDAAFERLVQERDALRDHVAEIQQTLSALEALIAFNRKNRPAQTA